MSNFQQHITRIKAVARALQDLNEVVVYVGGAVVSLYISNPDIAELRPTDDIDVVIEVESRGHYMQLQEKLRLYGFKEDHTSTVICRWNISGITVDIMPDNQDILAFSNRWYKDGIATMIQHTLDDVVINKFTPAYFIASKLEALHNRPDKLDWRWSQVLEDIIKVSFDVNLLQEELNDEMKKYFKDQFQMLTKDVSILEEAIGAHLVAPFYTEDDIDDITGQFLDYAEGF